MGLFDRLKTGWALSMDSVDVLRDEPSLTVFPVIAGLAGTVYLVLVLGGATLVLGSNAGVLMYAALFVGYLGSAFIASFFSAALMWNAREVFHGRDPTLGEGLGAAWRNRRPLFVWAVISAVVGLVLNALESSDSPLADLASVLFSVAWSILTYFVVPVIVFEDVGAREMFERSGETFKRTWGETAGASFGVGIVTILFTLVGLALAVVLFVLLGGTGVGILVAIAVGVIVLLLAYLFGTTLSAVAKTALYVYATEGERPPQFENVDFQAAAGQT
ncbi:DUF6159 family protein [Halorarius litoreus]|uniref:DUF6159 family protein n=1 Tax=Halorarius litoreus TaxID=2962676 RepID=UPI0020CC070C|nr:DUF6159 family protein [Halorarius litoreus]